MSKQRIVLTILAASIAFANSQTDTDHRMKFARLQRAVLPSPSQSGRREGETYRDSAVTDTGSHFPKVLRSDQIQSMDSRSETDRYAHSTYGLRDSWNPSWSWNATYGRQRDTDRVRSSYHSEPTEGGRSVHRHHYVRSPMQSGHAMSKHRSPYYGKDNIAKTSENSRYRKPVIAYYSNSVGYKKNAPPRIRISHAIEKTVHPLYRRYHQLSRPFYAVHFADVKRSKPKSDEPHSQGFGHYRSGDESSTTSSPLTATDRLYIRDERNDFSSKSEDSGNDSETLNTGTNNYSYDNYEDTAEPNSSYREESSTRGYYGDRIYMSTQVPVMNSDKGMHMMHRLFIVGNDSEDGDDADTVFD